VPTGGQVDLAALEAEGDDDEVEVLPINLRAVDVYRRCQMTVLSGMATMYLGVSALETRAALELSQVPPDQWAEIADDVQVMSAAAVGYLRDRK
jgi:hypothetical protein